MKVYFSSAEWDINKQFNQAYFNGNTSSTPVTSGDIEDFETWQGTKDILMGNLKDGVSLQKSTDVFGNIWVFAGWSGFGIGYNVGPTKKQFISGLLDQLVNQ
jgi:hypothetical protein